MILTEICAYLRNYFRPVKHSGNFEITSGKISGTDFLKEKQYFRITGSVLNDGVYSNVPEDLSTLQDEKFSGEIWAMSIPPEFLKLCEDIQAWRLKNENPESVNMSPYTSESFGGYSYSKTNSRAGEQNSGNAVTWHGQFAGRLNIWRKI